MRTAAIVRRMLIVAALVVLTVTVLVGCTASQEDPGSSAPDQQEILGFPQPGQVGFLGDPSTLTVIDSSETAPTGTRYADGVLVVDAAYVTLDGVHLKGSIDYAQAGTLTIRNSIIEAVGGYFTVINGSDPDGTIDISDSTVTWPRSIATPEPPWGSGAINGDARMVVVRCDISGTPDGIQQGTGNSRFEQNYIHDLALLGEVPDNTHNDGMQFYAGPNIRVLYNYIELNGFDGEHQNAAVFFSEGSGTAAPVIVGNYLSGGGYQLRLQSGVSDATVTGNTFGPIAGGYGEVNIAPGATVAVWSDNVTSSGAQLPQPRPG